MELYVWQIRPPTPLSLTCTAIFYSRYHNILSNCIVLYWVHKIVCLCLCAVSEVTLMCSLLLFSETAPGCLIWYSESPLIIQELVGRKREGERERTVIYILVLKACQAWHTYPQHLPLCVWASQTDQLFSLLSCFIPGPPTLTRQKKNLEMCCWSSMAVISIHIVSEASENSLLFFWLWCKHK